MTRDSRIFITSYTLPMVSVFLVQVHRPETKSGPDMTTTSRLALGTPSAHAPGIRQAPAHHSRRQLRHDASLTGLLSAVAGGWATGVPWPYGPQPRCRR